MVNFEKAFQALMPNHCVYSVHDKNVYGSLRFTPFSFDDKFYLKIETSKAELNVIFCGYAIFEIVQDGNRMSGVLHEVSRDSMLYSMLSDFLILCSNGLSSSCGHGLVPSHLLTDGMDVREGTFTLNDDEYFSLDADTKGTVAIRVNNKLETLHFDGFYVSGLFKSYSYDLHLAKSMFQVKYNKALTLSGLSDTTAESIKTLERNIIRALYSVFKKPTIDLVEDYFDLHSSIDSVEFRLLRIYKVFLYASTVLETDSPNLMDNFKAIVRNVKPNLYKKLEAFYTHDIGRMKEIQITRSSYPKHSVVEAIRSDLSGIQEVEVSTFNAARKEVSKLSIDVSECVSLIQGWLKSVIACIFESDLEGGLDHKVAVKLSDILNSVDSPERLFDAIGQIVKFFNAMESMRSVALDPMCNFEYSRINFAYQFIYRNTLTESHYFMFAFEYDSKYHINYLAGDLSTRMQLDVPTALRYTNHNLKKWSES